MDPPPSEAEASGTIPAATAAALPPEEPPGERERSYGFRVGPKASGSVTPISASSGVFVLPKGMSPAARKRATTSAV
jgi:hypothetical protein